jgi:penicillin-binding protein 1A
MRTLLRIILFLAGTVILVLLAAFCWLYFYSRDLPDVTALAQFAPGTSTQASDPCRGKSAAIPYNAIGTNFRNALSAAEGSGNDSGVLTTLFREFTTGKPSHGPTLTYQISRAMFCEPSRMMKRQVEQLRTAVQLQRRYSTRELFTIFANRANFGEGLIGVQAASSYFFHKNPSELDVAEAALLAGLLKSPMYYSPVKHSDRAVQRRNEVIDAMANAHAISISEAESAKAAKLAIVSTDSVNMGQ